MSQYQWVLNFANSIVGVGVLAMPFCFQQCGIFLASAIIICAAMIAKKTSEFLLRTGSYTRKWSFEQIAFNIYGPIGKLITELSIIGLILGTLVAYQVVIGDLSPSVAHYYFGLQDTWYLRLVMMTLSSGVVLPLCFLRLSNLSMFNTASMVFYFIFITTVVAFALPNFLSFRWIDEVNFWRPEAFFKCLPIIALAFTCQTQVLGMYNALPEPNLKSMNEIIDKAINLVAAIYITVGTFGYLAFYNVGHIHGDVLSNFEKGFFTEALKFGFWGSVVISFPLMTFPVRASINSLLYANKEKGVLHDVISSAADYIAPDRFLYITVSLVGGTLIIGVLVPQIELVLSITGALVGTFLCFVFPSVLYLVGGPKETMRNLAKFILVISLLTMVLSTSSILANLNAGPPNPQPMQTNIVEPQKVMPDQEKFLQMSNLKKEEATTIEPVEKLIISKEVKANTLFSQDKLEVEKIKDILDSTIKPLAANKNIEFNNVIEKKLSKTPAVIDLSKEAKELDNNNSNSIQKNNVELDLKKVETLLSDSIEKVEDHTKDVTIIKTTSKSPSKEAIVKQNESIQADVLKPSLKPDIKESIAVGRDILRNEKKR